MIGIRSLAGIALLVAALQSVARAESEERRDPIAAEALFQRGKELMDHGRIPEACQAFAESQRLDPAGGTLLRLALCHEADKKLASAWLEYLEVMRMSREGGGDPAKLAERIRIVGEHLDAIEPRVPRLVVEVPLASRADGLRVTVNGLSRAEGSWGVAIPIDPGDVTIVATAPSRRVFRATLHVDEAGRPHVELPPLERERVYAPVAAYSAATPTAPERSGLRLVGLGVGGLGIAALAAGAYFGLRAISKWNDSNALCAQTECFGPAVSLAQDAKQSATIADVTIGAGALAVAVGLALYIVGTPKNLQVQGVPIAVAF
jgi:hypothetical protein